MRLVNRFCFAVLAGLVLVGSAVGARDPGASDAWPSGTAVVSYESEQALTAALDRIPARVVRRIGHEERGVVRLLVDLEQRRVIRPSDANGRRP